LQTSSLQRVTSGGRFIPEIDGLRFIAIASVAAYHLQFLLWERVHLVAAPTGAVALSIWHGYRGVPLFFIISGFILGLPFGAHYLQGRPKVQLGRYFLRRLTRLEPPYVLNLLICFVLLVVVKRVSGGSILPNLGASLVYLHNVIYGKGSLINGVAWSLEVEIQFYCLVPLLATVFAVRNRLARRGVLVAAICAAVGLQVLFPPNAASAVSTRLQFTILYYVQYFLAGFLLADVYLTDWNEAPKHPPTLVDKERPQGWATRTVFGWDVASLMGWPLLFYMSEGLARYAFVPLALLLYFATFRGVVFRRILSHPLLTTIGGMCYTIYLFHSPVIAQIIPRTGRLMAGRSYYSYFGAQAVLAGCAVMAVSVVYFVLIEQPCMRRDWPQRLVARLAVRSRPAAQEESDRYIGA
jgi:peptidoglycan/LPS O-acetylase OafA/YrhL